MDSKFLKKRTFPGVRLNRPDTEFGELDFVGRGVDPVCKAVVQIQLAARDVTRHDRDPMLRIPLVEDPEKDIGHPIPPGRLLTQIVEDQDADGDQIIERIAPVLRFRFDISIRSDAETNRIAATYLSASSPAIAEARNVFPLPLIRE